MELGFTLSLLLVVASGFKQPVYCIFGFTCSQDGRTKEWNRDRHCLRCGGAAKAVWNKRRRRTGLGEIGTETSNDWQRGGTKERRE